MQNLLEVFILYVKAKKIAFQGNNFSFFLLNKPSDFYETIS